LGEGRLIASALEYRSNRKLLLPNKQGEDLDEGRKRVETTSQTANSLCSSDAIIPGDPRSSYLGAVYYQYRWFIMGALALCFPV
jgi:hypothetical protein